MMNSDLQDYIERHIDREPEHLRQLERESNLHLLNGRMCSGHLQGRLLKMLISMAAPRNVLELGTFSGYSALCIAEALGKEATLHTVEANDEMEEFILKTFAASEHGSKITLHICDALEFCSRQPDESFDVVYIDADKRQYTHYYEESLRVLRPGGYIIADNTLWDGHVVQPECYRDNQTRGIMEFNDKVARDARVEKVIIPLRDGLTIIRKLETPPTC